MIEFFQEQLNSNQFFQGAVGATVVGGLMAYCKSVPAQIYKFIKKKSTVSITMTNDHRNLKDFLKWTLSFKTFSKIKTVNAFSRSSGFLNQETGDVLAPATGTYFGFIGGRPASLSISMERTEQGNWTWVVTLSCLGLSRKILEDFYDSFKKSIPREDEKNYVTVYNLDAYDWTEASKTPRPISSVFLNGGLKKEILDDLDRFFSSRDWYIERGLSHKRVYVLYGPPGTGKTSLAMSLATHLKKDVYNLNFSDFSSDSSFLNNWSLIPKGSVILIEDIDAQVVSLSRDKGDGKKVTLSTLLNALDGVNAADGCLVIITTNNLESLDPAITRKGRTDKMFEIEYFSFDTAKQMADYFLGSDSKDLVEEAFGKKEGNYIKPADLQEILKEKLLTNL